MNGRSTSILSRLERGPSRLEPHYMLGLALGDGALLHSPLPKLTRKASDKIGMVQNAILRIGPATRQDLARAMKKKAETVRKWITDGVKQGRLIVVKKTKGGQGPQIYDLPADYDPAASIPKSPSSATEEIIEIMRSQPGGVDAQLVSTMLGVSSRTARRRLSDGKLAGIFEIVREHRNGVCTGLFDLVGNRNGG